MHKIVLNCTHLAVVVSHLGLAGENHPEVLDCFVNYCYSFGIVSLNQCVA